MRKIALFLIFVLLLTALCPMLLSCGDDPEPELRNLTWAVGAPLPAAEDFVVFLPEGAKVRFAKNYSFSHCGDYTLTLIVERENGKESEHTVRFSLVEDHQPPTIYGTKDFSVLLGSGVSYRTGVSVSDNCDGRLTLDVDASAVDTSRVGQYPVIYKATDAVGNYTTVTVSVWVWQESVTEEMLYAEVDRLIASHVTATDKLTQARQVYDFVHGSVSYTDESDKGDWVRAAWEGIRTGEGDCFTYFALSKAFFNRLGIESMDVKRMEGISIQRHYWNFVNIGTATSPSWYHFDACPIRGETARFGCLLTDEQVAAYTAQRTITENGVLVSNFFYAYDTTLYPASAVQIINPQ